MSGERFARVVIQKAENDSWPDMEIDGKIMTYMNAYEAVNHVNAAHNQAVREAVGKERARNIELIRKYLSFASQRAVSWHEVNDCIEAIRKLAEKARK